MRAAVDAHEIAADQAGELAVAELYLVRGDVGVKLPVGVQVSLRPGGDDRRGWAGASSSRR